jgi:hypothetical protein
VDSQEAHAGSSEYIVVPTGFTWIRIDACLFSLSTPYVFFAYISKNGTDFAGPFSMYIQSGNSSSLLMTTGWFPTVAGDTYHLEAFEMIGNHPVIGGATKSFFAAEFR